MKKKVLDIMIDFETFGRQPNSVPINLAVVAFNRYAKTNPFVIPGIKSFDICECIHNLPEINNCGVFSPCYYNSRFHIMHFDVCACLLEGMTVEKETQDWWSSQSITAKKDLLLEERKLQTPFQVITEFSNWLSCLKKEVKADEICIWSQGSDFDIAKLRFLVDRCKNLLSDNNQNFKHTIFRDARTVILELGAKLYDGKRSFYCDKETGTIVLDGEPNKKEEIEDFNDIYDKIYPLDKWAKHLQLVDGVATESEGIMSNYLFNLAVCGEAHNSLYDCMRSIYNVWWLNKAIETQMI